MYKGRRDWTVRPTKIAYCPDGDSDDHFLSVDSPFP